MTPEDDSVRGFAGLVGLVVSLTGMWTGFWLNNVLDGSWTRFPAVTTCSLVFLFGLMILFTRPRR